MKEHWLGVQLTLGHGVLAAGPLSANVVNDRWISDSQDWAIARGGRVIYEGYSQTFLVMVPVKDDEDALRLAGEMSEIGLHEPPGGFDIKPALDR